MRRPLLLPLLPLYATGSALRNLSVALGWPKIRALYHPVISIGNLSTGGSGKTPFAMTLARLLTANGFQVDVLSRGYGRKGRTPARVLIDGNSEQFGDEPLLIARDSGVPVYVAQQRYQAGRLAEEEIHHLGRTRVHILDDGFQHRQLFRDIDILLLNRDDWRDHLLPAGNLRESLRSIKRASVIAIPADDPELGKELRKSGWRGPLWRLRRSMDIPQVTGPVIAFCGIARPGQFLSGLKSAGLSLAAEITFADHHQYSIHDVERLISLGRTSNATSLITTEKDEVRLGNFASDFPSWLPLKTASLQVQLEDEETAMNWIEKDLARSRGAHEY